MPYALVQVSTRPARWVVVTKATLQPHSKEGMTKAKAQAQLRVLDAALQKGGRGVGDDFVRPPPSSLWEQARRIEAYAKEYLLTHPNETEEVNAWVRKMQQQDVKEALDRDQASRKPYDEKKAERVGAAFVRQPHTSPETTLTKQAEAYGKKYLLTHPDETEEVKAWVFKMWQQDKAEANAHMQAYEDQKAVAQKTNDAAMRAMWGEAWDKASGPERVQLEFRAKMIAKYPEWDSYSEKTQKAIALQPFVNGIAEKMGPFMGAILKGMNDPILAEGIQHAYDFLIAGGIELAKAVLKGDPKSAFLQILKKSAPAFAYTFTASHKDPTPAALAVRKIAQKIAGEGLRGAGRLHDNCAICNEPLEQENSVIICPNLHRLHNKIMDLDVGTSCAKGWWYSTVVPEAYRHRCPDCQEPMTWRPRTRLPRPRPAPVPAPTPEEGEGLAANVYHFFTGKYQGERALQKFLHTHGEKRIQSIRLFREPVKGALQKIVNWFTKGDLEKQMGKNAYDKLFHLSMYIELSGGASVTLEKNSAFTTHVGKLQYGVEAQSLVVPMHAHPEVREFIYNAIKRAGAKDFFVYDAFSKNCQDSMYNMLQANGLMTPAVADWIRQNLLDVAQKHPAAANLFTAITDLHGIFTGGGRPLTDLYTPQQQERRRRMEAEAIAELRLINEQSRERRERMEAIERTRRAQADAAARNRQQGQGLVSLRELLGEGY